MLTLRILSEGTEVGTRSVESKTEAVAAIATYQEVVPCSEFLLVDQYTGREYEFDVDMCVFHLIEMDN